MYNKIGYQLKPKTNWNQINIEIKINGEDREESWDAGVHMVTSWTTTEVELQN